MSPHLRDTMDVCVGLSCHNRGMAICFAVAGMGADLIAKPVTNDNTQDGDEHIFSLNIEEILEFDSTIRQIVVAKGLANRDPRALLDSEHARKTWSQPLVAARDLEAGHRLDSADISFARPGWGVAAAERLQALGAVLRRAIAAENAIYCADIANKAQHGIPP